MGDQDVWFDSQKMQECFFFFTTFTSFLGPTQLSYLVAPVACFSPGVKWLQHETAHSSPCSVRVRNDWSYTFTPPCAFYNLEHTRSTLPFVHWISRQRSFEEELFVIHAPDVAEAASISSTWVMLTKISLR
jgi:hypothetical protein